MRREERGFTLVELVITVAIAAIVLAIGVPMLDGFTRATRLTSTTNTLVAALHYARSESVQRAEFVSICASADQATCTGGTDWSVGWIVFVDDAAGGAGDGARDTGAPERLLRVGDAVQALSVDTAGVSAVTYDAEGTLENAAGVTFTLEPDDCEDGIRQIDVNLSGRPRATEAPCP